MDAVLLPLHLGALHPAEKVLTLVLAFGPFLLLAVVIMLRRRQDARDSPDAPGPESQRDR
ncbi:hypothetical protein [Nocardioides aquiterrae]|uniref:Uncharacterized protein n=1 Tax=Nocardioides aquiterrae TaxID=203799 RepID=A0ABN1UFN3_9ACTN